MIDGLIPTLISPPGSDGPLEIELTIADLGEAAPSGAAQPCTLTVLLVIGPPDPNALSYLLPRHLFERGAPVHVGALAIDTDEKTDGANYPAHFPIEDTAGTLLEPMLEILEVMAPGDMVVFLCQDVASLTQACQTLGLNPPAFGVGLQTSPTPQ